MTSARTVVRHAAMACALVCFATLAGAQTVEKPARAVSTLIKTAAIVEAVNKSTREIKLIDARGNRFSLIADDRVRNFDQIDPRDRIVVEYLESIAIVVAPAGSEPLLGKGAVVTVASEGDKPGITGVETHVVVATIAALNRGDRLVTLETEDGEIRTIKIGEDAHLDMVDVGDQVRLRVTRAIAIEVVKPDTD